ncbi:hypothetical protein GALL_517090 [mine drainage metagenome]|uniref:Uncharacterized protein n=1 Tax=mine drainage metagenome TaxID=410659 RepID=A0A1J5PFX1_9ZZZZ
MDACPANGFVHVKEVFSFAKGVQHDRHGTAVNGVRPDPQQVVQQPRDLGKHDTDVLGTQGHLQAQHFLHSKTVALLIAHHRHVVESVHVRQGLQKSLGLCQLFGPPMQQAYVRVGPLDNLTVELQYQAQDTVRSRVLWTKVKGVVLYLSHSSSCLL